MFCSFLTLHFNVRKPHDDNGVFHWSDVFVVVTVSLCPSSQNAENVEVHFYNCIRDIQCLGSVLMSFLCLVLFSNSDLFDFMVLL